MKTPDLQKVPVVSMFRQEKLNLAGFAAQAV